MSSKQIKCWLLSGLVLVSGSMYSLPISGEQAQSGDKGQVVTDEQVNMETESLSLSYTPADDLFMLRDKTNDVVWYNTPPNVEEDTVAQGSIKKEMESSLIVSYIDDKNNSFTANSETSCVGRSTSTVYKTQDGLLVEYDFSRTKEQFVIPVLYKLDGNHFTAEILFNQIREYGTNKICDIKLLPYFGAGKTGEDGFLFIPDGSGAIVDFKNDRGWAENYSKQIYGKDPAKSEYSYSAEEEQIYMPVYGIQKEKSAFLAIIEDGDANASIDAIQAGNSSEFASVSPVFNYRILDSMKMYDKYGTEKNVTFESKKTVEENPRVSFFFTPKGKYSLTDMAQLYRNYMMSEKGLKRLAVKDEVPLFLDVYGMSEKKESFLGFLMDRPVTATTITDLQNIEQALSDAGVNRSVMSLYYFNKAGTGSGVIQNLILDQAIGSQADFQKLAEEGKVKGIELFYGINNVRIHRSTWGWWSFNCGATNMLQTKLNEYEYMQSTRSINKKNSLWFYLKPEKLTQALSSKAYQQFQKAGAEGLIFQKTSSTLYSDNKLNSYSARGTTRQAYEAWYQQAQNNNMSLLADGANVYALPYSRYITHVPVSTSRFDICTQPVPFYQMVFHGLKPLASTPANAGEDTTQAFLQCLLTGTAMNYNLTGKSSVVLKDTVLNTLLSTDYKDWVPEITANYQSYQAIHEQLGDQFIVGYTRSGTVEEVVYENGTAVAVNTGALSVNYNGIEIAAGSYRTYQNRGHDERSR